MVQCPPVNPFTLDGQWYKAALHTHTTYSDGRLSPAELVAWYRERNYHVLAVTDHGRVASVNGLSASDFLVLPGAEWHGGSVEDGTHYHVLLVDIKASREMPRDVSMENAVQAAQATGALVFAAHPYWSGQTSAQLAAANGIVGLEVYNDVTQVRYGLGISAVHWDEVLARGRLLYGLAVDDLHDPSIEGDGGWTWVKAPALTQPAIRRALEQGAFYASTGPVIYDIHVQDETVRVRCSPVVSIGFMATAFYGTLVQAPPGETIQEACYTLHGKERYLRIECTDAAGGRAWSNPVVWDQKRQE
ncbi:MAG: CehA/McbA family metallohydrolase [Anaerolineae bacterium]|nr:MAG: CehA/McbA family metallohydrolase [Anaerolineae bacterium]